MSERAIVPDVTHSLVRQSGHSLFHSLNWGKGRKESWEGNSKKMIQSFAPSKVPVLLSVLTPSPATKSHRTTPE